mmetsp:Transcript_4200/g.12301  ORF Transcript_4200/g.12301 Transcript_4200/m.12301 type:complete len:293 (-) Transcript_4200:186-1064(-)
MGALRAVLELKVDAVHRRPRPAGDPLHGPRNEERRLRAVRHGRGGEAPEGKQLLAGHAAQPGVSQAAPVRQPLVRVKDEQAAHEVLALLGDARPRLAALDGLVEDALHVGRIVVLVEGEVATEHHVQDNSKAPEVDALVVVVLHDLRGEIVRSPAGREELSDYVQPSRQPKVRDLHVVEGALDVSDGRSRAGNEDVLCLQVPVDDPPLVHVPYTPDQLAGHVLRGMLRARGIGAQAYVARDLLAQITLASKVHDNEAIAALLPERVVQAHDVGVVELPQRPDLTSQQHLIPR